MAFFMPCTLQESLPFFLFLNVGILWEICKMHVITVHPALPATEVSAATRSRWWGKSSRQFIHKNITVIIFQKHIAWKVLQLGNIYQVNQLTRCCALKKQILDREGQRNE
jgi:hypothetical protein